MPDLMTERPTRSGASKATRESVKPLTRDDVLALIAGFSDPGGMTTGALGDSPAAARISADKAASPTASTIGDMLNPIGVLPTLWEGAKGAYAAWNEEGEKAPVLKSRDDFFSERRSSRETLEQALMRAEKETTESKEYRDFLKENRRKGAADLVTKRKASAEDTWNKSQGTIGDEDARLEDDYKTYASGHDKRLKEFYGRDFADRHPGLSSGLQIAAPLAAAVLTRGAFKGVNAKTDKLAGLLSDAWDGGDVAKYAKVAGDAKDWQKAAPKVKAVSAGLAASLPFDARIAGTVNDSKQSREYQDSQGNWKRSRAQENASNDLLDPSYYAKELVTGLVSGGLGAATGAKSAGMSENLIGSLARQPAADDIAKLEALKIAGLDSNARVAQRMAQPPLAAPSALESLPAGGPNMELLGGRAPFPNQAALAPPAGATALPIPAANSPGSTRAAQGRGDLLEGLPATAQESLPAGAAVDIGSASGALMRIPRPTQRDRDLMAEKITETYQKGGDIDIEQLVNGSRLSVAKAAEVKARMQPILDSSLSRNEKVEILKKMIADGSGKFAAGGIVAGGAGMDLMAPSGGGY